MSQPLPPLKIFTDAAGCSAAPCTMLQPLLGHPPPAAGGPVADYGAVAPRLFQLVARDEAEVAVLAWDWQVVRDTHGLLGRARSFIHANAAAGLRTLVFFPHDQEPPLREPHTLVFRTSLLGSQRQRHEFAMPWLTGNLPPFVPGDPPSRPWRPTPSVGFCGASYRQSFRTPSWLRRTFRPGRCQYERAFPRPPGLRATALDRLAATPGLETRFIERDGFMGGAMRPDGTLDHGRYEQAQRDFFDNLLGTDYALCARGGGNFSIRFFQALSVGRIPLLIDTDCVMPWPDDIPWQELCVRVDRREVDGIGGTLLREHKRMGPDGFAARQAECRAVWRRHLCATGFFTTLREWLGRQNLDGTGTVSGATRP